VLVPRIGEIKQTVNDTDGLFHISYDVTVADAAQQMSNYHVGSLAVFDENQNFVGIITERDMLSKVLAKSLSPKEILVKDVMTTSLFSCTARTSVNEAEKLMSTRKIRHLPILKKGKIVGMISSRDLIAYRMKSNKDMQVAAEQLAMLPMGLKSLELADVVSLAVNEVPKSFNASNATFCLASKGSDESIIYCNNCTKGHEELIKAALEDKMPQTVRINIGRACQGCENKDSTISKMVIPLRINDQCDDKGQEQALNGFLCMCRPAQKDEKIEQSQLYKASLLQQVLNVNLTNAKLYESYQKARRDSETDPLTGVGTRRVLENVLKLECARSKRYDRIFSLAIVDLDKFKQINDKAGHAAGDKALKQLAKLMRKNTRETDIVIARYGGDEFVLVMPETNLSGAKILLERIRRQVVRLDIAGIESPSISSGITEWNHEPPDTPEMVMARADSALYDAKKNGRNRVATAMPEPVSIS
jgi:diguanylate cyclase (GGDEF)-like protein